ncbi:unnamed protein product [Caenorhabditis angaria]|uniref:Uncharacterized protein n=1 Tax=Caenorhabditis angaria TaxID=860376 RepID=A0A9P1IDS8_9PELO|nr:unnamed protein product [Caenorhabditis angaria]
METKLKNTRGECEFDPTLEEMEKHRRLMNEREIEDSKKCLKKLFKEYEATCLCGKCNNLDDMEYCCASIFPSNVKFQANIGKLVSEKLEEKFWKGEHNRCLVDCDNFEKYLDEETLKVFKTGYKFGLGIDDNS